MKVVWALFLFGAGLLTASAQNSWTRLERFELFGHTYVRLSDWARAKEFDLKWTSPDKELQLTNRSTRLFLTVDSRRAELNGVSVWLSAPVAAGRGTAYIGLVDLQSLIHPILYPEKGRAGERVRTICLDPGHGGHDPGYQVGRHQEKNFTLLLAKEVRKVLEQAGFKVVLTRATDVYVGKLDRPGLAKRKRADLFVSLHYNAAHAGTNVTRGLEVYCLTPPGAQSTNVRGEAGDTHSQPGNHQDARNVLLAYQLHKTLVRNLAMEDRGLRRARFAVLRTAEMPAVLIECGFMSDPMDAKKILDATWRRKMAQIIARGIQSYQRVVEP